MPFEVTPESFAAAVVYARELRAAAGRPGELACVAPLGAPADASAEALLAEIARWQRAGATAFHVGIGAESLAQYLGRLEWFGREVIPRVA